MRSDEDTLAALQRGDEQAFVELVGRHQALMLRVASRYVRNTTVAEEVVQETWLGVLNGLDRFECRASLKTWIFRILTNRAISRARLEKRVVPFSSLSGGRPGEPGVDPERFRTGGERWEELPEERLLSHEALGHIGSAIVSLPDRQHAVIVMRDVEGWSAEEVCEQLEISEGNQRVLLHRARTKVRLHVASYLDLQPAPI